MMTMRSIQSLMRDRPHPGRSPVLYRFVAATVVLFALMFLGPLVIAGEGNHSMQAPSNGQDSGDGDDASVVVIACDGQQVTLTMSGERLVIASKDGEGTEVHEIDFAALRESIESTVTAAMRDIERGLESFLAHVGPSAPQQAALMSELRAQRRDLRAEIATLQEEVDRLRNDLQHLR